MDRRNFFKLVGTASGGALTGACGNQARELIPLLVPEKTIVPGEEAWHPSVCRECGAGCGTIVRVMESERQIEIEGEMVRQRIAAIKKVEGNPLDPVSGGRLCARGQASVQALYHPDRLRGPRKRSGERGSAGFAPVGWEDALKEAGEILSQAAQTNPAGIVYLSRGPAGTRSETIARFLQALGAEPASSTGFGDFAVERRAAELLFGWQGLPVYEVQDATHVLGIGADFLGGWVSPVFYARRFGHMRQGRPALRGSLIQAESRFSQTAWSADRWLPVRPGGEQALALAVGHLLLAEGRADAGTPQGIRQIFEAVDLDAAVQRCGVEQRLLRRVARELAEASSPLVVAGASIVQTNSLQAVSAGNALNILLGNVGKPGGVMPPAAPFVPEWQVSRPAYRDIEERLRTADVVLLDGANPAYTHPAAAGLLSRVKAVISFSSFLDDSAAYADLILPDHSPFESAAAVSPDASPVAAVTGSRAYVQPLYDTRSTEQVLGELASKAGKSMNVETPASAFGSIFERQAVKEEWSGADEFVRYGERQGGWWGERDSAAGAGPATTAARTGAASTAVASPTAASIDALQDPAFDGGAEEFPLHFQPYPSLQFGDGSGANLPWLQQTPDPASSAMWGLPVEVDPQTAAKLDLNNGDTVRMTSPAGQIEASVYVHPAAIPGVVSMAIGQGHTHYGRYSSGRGSNPLSIVAARKDAGTGAPAFGATRVRLEKVSSSQRLVQFARTDRNEHQHRP
jgi:anaerobic selenocysteine-containing dehydrogenase